jgi:hypothetical protein
VENLDGTDRPLHFGLGFGIGTYNTSQSFLVNPDDNIGRLTWFIGPYVSRDSLLRPALFFYTQDLALENPHLSCYYGDDFDGNCGPRQFFAYHDIRLCYQSTVLKSLPPPR